MFISLQYFNHQKRDACFGYLLLAICLLLLLPLLLNRVAWKKSETKSSPGEKSENDNTLQSMGTLAQIWWLVSHRKMWFAWAGFSQKKLPCNRLITPGGSRVGGKDAKVNLLCWSDFWWLRPPKVSWLIEDFFFSITDLGKKESVKPKNHGGLIRGTTNCRLCCRRSSRRNQRILTTTWQGLESAILDGSMWGCKMSRNKESMVGPWSISALR